jgi:hypothetical protein
MSDLKDSIAGARALISTPASWCQGNPIIQGRRMTLLGALDRATTRNPRALIDAVREALPVGYRYAGGIIAFNNAPTTTHADVMGVFDRALDAAKREIADG